MTRLLVMVWTYLDTGDVAKVVSLNWSILAYTLPSFVLFIAFPLLLKAGLNFWPSLLIACFLTGIVYKICQPMIDRAGA